MSILLSNQLLIILLRIDGKAVENLFHIIPLLIKMHSQEVNAGQISSQNFVHDFSLLLANWSHVIKYLQKKTLNNFNMDTLKNLLVH